MKDLFDVSTLVGLLKTDRRESLLSNYTKTLRKALDRVCRILFKYYWDKDSFIERFGEDHIEKFEESLKDSLDILGDLVLFLVQKDDRPSIEDFLSGINSDDSEE